MRGLRKVRLPYGYRVGAAGWAVNVKSKFTLTQFVVPI